MTETITVNSVDRSGVIPRKDVEWVESAYLGEAGQGRYILEDDAGTISQPGFKPITVEQSSSTPSRIFTGFIGRKGISRGEGLLTGAARHIEVSTYDLNDLLHRKLIRAVDSETGIRPAETVGARVTWLLATTFVSDLFADFGAVTYPSDVGMDKADYRGSYPGDVLAACAKAVRFNYYIRYKSGETLGELVFRDDNLSTADTCTLSITNVMADINSTTVFATQPAETVLAVDPEHVYSGAYQTYTKGAVYETRAATATAFVERDSVTEDSGTRDAATARRDAQTFLWESHTEEQLLPVVLRLRASKVGLVQAGQRISVRQTHMAPEGWDPAIYARILRKRVTQPLNTDNDYDVHLDLSPQEPGPVAGAIVQSAFGFWGIGGAAVGFGGGPMHLPNPPSIGNVLLVAISHRVNADINPVNAPNTSAALDRWGPGAWTDMALDLLGQSTTYVEHLPGDGAGQTMAFFWKVVDSTNQDCAILNDYENVGVWEFSGIDMATAVLQRANSQAAATTADVGTLGTVASGELAFIMVHWTPGETANFAVTPDAGWLADQFRGNYPYWGGPTDPIVWMGHAIGAGATVNPALTRAVARPWCGLAFKVGP